MTNVWEMQIYNEITTKFDELLRGSRPVVPPDRSEPVPKALLMPKLSYLLIDKSREKELHANYWRMSAYTLCGTSDGLFFQWGRHKLEVVVVNKPDFLMVL